MHFFKINLGIIDGYSNIQKISIINFLNIILSEKKQKNISNNLFC